MLKKSIWQKQLPTLLGLGILIIALIVGVVVFTVGGGAGVFAPRATAQSTPKKIKITNVTDTGFTVSFLTDAKVPGFVKYGNDPKKLKSQASDDRDQLSGTIGNYQLHHITIRGLKPATTYYYLIGTGSGATFDNQGKPFAITTAKRQGAPSAAKAIYGNVLNSAGGPAGGAIVYVSLPNVGEMSSLVKNSGSWAIPLSNARLADGSGYAKIANDQILTIRVQGFKESQTAALTVPVNQAQPVETIKLAANGTTQISKTVSPSPKIATVSPIPTISQTESQSLPSPTPSLTPILNQELTASDSAASNSGEPTVSQRETVLQNQNAGIETNSATESATVDLEGPANQTVNTTQPIIIGKAPAKTTVKIEIHSDTAITQQLTADADGSFSIDLSQLGANLEPGEHTVTITYQDPQTGETVTKTQTFVVAQSATANIGKENQGPYGSANPYPATGTEEISSGSATASDSTQTGSVSGRTSMPATGGALPVSGSAGTTLALIVGGIFFCLAGLWSFWVANQYQEGKI